MYQPLIKFHPYPAIITQVLTIFAPDRKQVDFGRGNGSFPVGSDSREKNGKKGGFGPEKQVKNGFSTV